MRFKKVLNALVLITILFICTELKAQYDPLFNQYQFNTLSINPAYAGSRDVLSTAFIHRSQWVGFEGAPITQSFTLHSPISTSNTSLGLSLTNDQIGPMSQLLVFGDYSYRFKLSSRAKLSLGISAGINQMKIDYNSLESNEIDDAYNQGIVSKTLPNAGFGLYLNHSKYFVGISIPRLIENDYSTTETGSELIGTSETRTYYFITGAIFKLSEHLKLKPSILTRGTEAMPFTTDFNLNLIINENLWTGIMYRPGNAWGIILQYQLSPQFKFGYAFDQTTTDLQSSNSGSHEFMIMYELNLKKSNIYNPRYF